MKKWFANNAGEIATVLTLLTVALMTMGIFVGSQMAQQDTDLRSKAEGSCALTDLPSLEQGANGSAVTCVMPAVQNTQGLVCAVIGKTNPGDTDYTDLIYNQNSQNWGGVWNGATARIPLNSNNGKTAVSGQPYRVVTYDIYNPNGPNGCVKKRDYTGDQILTGLPAYNSGGQPNNPPAATATPTIGIDQTSCSRNCDTSCVRTGTNWRCPTSTPTPTLFLVSATQCQQLNIGTCTPSQSCGSPGDPRHPAAANYGCSQVDSNLVCCSSAAGTPAPTWTSTPKPTNTPVPTATRTPTPTTTPAQGATNAPQVTLALMPTAIPNVNNLPPCYDYFPIRIPIANFVDMPGEEIDVMEPANHDQTVKGLAVLPDVTKLPSLEAGQLYYFEFLSDNGSVINAGGINCYQDIRALVYKDDPNSEHLYNQVFNK